MCQPVVIHTTARNTRSLLPTWSVPACCDPHHGAQYQKSITYMKCASLLWSTPRHAIPEVYYLHEVCQPDPHHGALSITYMNPACCDTPRRAIPEVYYLHEVCQPAVIHTTARNTRSLLPTWSVPACCDPHHGIVLQMCTHTQWAWFCLTLLFEAGELLDRITEKGHRLCPFSMIG